MPTKTMEKPTTKARELARIHRRPRASSAADWSWSTDIPVMKERYEGKSGSTHGDRKENSPPPNATRIDSSPAIGYAPPARWGSCNRRLAGAQRPRGPAGQPCGSWASTDFGITSRTPMMGRGEVPTTRSPTSDRSMYASSSSIPWSSTR